MRKQLAVFALAAPLLLAGCHPRFRVASPQFQRSPEITCIVVVQSDKTSVEITRLAVSACKTALEQQEKKQ
jgi:hypothetical protein